MIDEGKSNRHVAVTSESLSYNIVIETQAIHWVHGYCNSGQILFCYVIKKTSKKTKSYSEIFFGVHLENKGRSVVPLRPY